MMKRKYIIVFLILFILIFLCLFFRNNILQFKVNMIFKDITNYCNQEKIGKKKTTYCKDEKLLKENLNKITKFKIKDVNISIRNNKIISFNLLVNGKRFGLLDNKMQEYTNNNNLINILLKHYNKDNTFGLLRDNETTRYYYKGTQDEVINNFIWYGGHQWRILEFDTSTKTVKLISQQPLTSIRISNDVWLNEEQYYQSHVNKWLNDYFYNTLDDNIKSNILETTFNVGLYDDVEEITVKNKIGLLDAKQFVNLGGKDSYLDIGQNWWLGNRHDSIRMAVIYSSDILYDGLKASNGVRPVITISDISISEGDGTLYKNYKELYDKKNIRIGDYLKIPHNGNECGNDHKCVFRVIDKNEDSYKIILNGLLPKPISLNSDFSDKNSYLNAFFNNINTKYKLINRTFIIDNMYDSDDLFEKNKSITANVGLPIIGELLTSNDIGISIYESQKYNKLFVDDNLIENSNIYTEYYTMNISDNKLYCNVINSSGQLYPNSCNLNFGLRPVLFISNNIDNIIGDGSPSSPYVLN